MTDKPNAPVSSADPMGAANPSVHQADPLKNAGTNAEGVGGTARTAKEAIFGEAGKLTSQAADKARGFAGEGKERATSALDDFAKMIEDAASTVDDKIGEQYGQYARSAAGVVSGFADNLRGKEVDDLVSDAREFVRKSPAVAIGAAAAVGFVVARLVKSGMDDVADRAEGTPNDKA